MKKILLALSAVCVTTSSSLLVTSCGVINPDPFTYLPSKTSISYEEFKANNIKPVAFNFESNSENELQIDFSPILIFTIKKGYGSFLGEEKYRSISNQFVNEYEYFNWFNQTPETSPTIEYQLTDDDLNSPMAYIVKTKDGEEEKEESFPMEQIVRVDNYQTPPTGQGSDLQFNVTLRKWKFKISSDEKGRYEQTDQTTSFQIFTHDLSLKDLKANKNYLEIIS